MHLRVVWVGQWSHYLISEQLWTLLLRPRATKLSLWYHFEFVYSWRWLLSINHLISSTTAWERSQKQSSRADFRVFREQSVNVRGPYFSWTFSMKIWIHRYIACLDWCCLLWEHRRESYQDWMTFLLLLAISQIFGRNWINDAIICSRKYNQKNLLFVFPKLTQVLNYPGNPGRGPLVVYIWPS